MSESVKIISPVDGSVYAERPIATDAAIDAALEEGHWVAGWMTYECGYALEPALCAHAWATAGRQLWFGVYDAPVELEPTDVTEALGPAAGRPAGARFTLDIDEYIQAVETLRAHIRDGDIYQANLTAPLDFTFNGDPLALYAGLRERQPQPGIDERPQARPCIPQPEISVPVQRRPDASRRARSPLDRQARAPR